MPVLVSGCTSTGGGMDASLAMGPGAEISLPDTVSVLPASYADGTVTEALPAAQDVEAAAFTQASYVKPDAQRGEVDQLIAKYAAVYEVPVELVRRVVKRESNFYPGAYHNGHWGLMQIKHATASGMGYDGPAKGLLDAETNLKYAVKYLRGAYLVAGGNHDRSVRFYARGYYYDAKRKGLLEETGLGTDRRRRRAATVATNPV